jgi:hypothetical protein
MKWIGDADGLLHQTRTPNLDIPRRSLDSNSSAQGR